MSTAVTIGIVAVIVLLSLRKYVKMSKNGCGCGCSSCPAKESCPSKQDDEK